MPARTPKPRAQLASFTAQTITDPLNQQNTAEAVRKVFEECNYSNFNRAEDKLSVDDIAGLQELIESLLATGAGGDAPFALTPTETIGGVQAGQAYNLSRQGYITKMLVKYQTPIVDLFTRNGSGNQTLEAGTVFPATLSLFEWVFRNAGNVALNTVDIRDESANVPLISNTGNDGQQSINTTGFTVVKGSSKLYSISAQNTNGDTFAGFINISGLFKSYFGYSSKTTLTIADILALGSGQLQNGHARTVSGVTAEAGLYTVYAWEDNAGNDDVAQVLQDGVDSIRGAFRGVQRVTGPNALGATVTMAYIISNATKAFTGSTLEFK